MKILFLVLAAMLTENFVLSKFLGICPFLGVSKRISTALGMAMAVLFVISVASMITFGIYQALLVPFGLEYLRTLVFILVIAAAVQLTEMAIQKLSPGLYQALGIFLPLITTNCAVLGVAVINVERGYNVLEVLFYSIGSAVGFGMALLLFAGIRERMELSLIPAPFRGAAVALITAGILSLAFMGFSGLIPTT